MALAQTEVRQIVAGVLLALFLAALEQTIVATALPSIAGELGDFGLISWVVTAYLLSSVCATPIAGKLSDIYGRRPALLCSLVIFVTGSVLCALSKDMISLILARTIQGFGGGGMMTLTYAVVADVVSPRERGRFAGYFSTVWISAALLGPVLGGLLSQHVGWPWIFWINIPLGLSIILISDKALRKIPVARRPGKVDYPGIAWLCIGAIALLLAVSLGGNRLAWRSPEIIFLAITTFVASALFVRRQRVAPEPVLPLRFFSDRVIGPVLGTGFLVLGSYFALIVLTPVFFQFALNVSAGKAGLLMIPMMLATSGSAVLGGTYNRRSGRYRTPVLVGLPISVLCLVAISIFVEKLSPAGASCLLAGVGLGLGSLFPCSIVAAQNAASPRDLGAVSAAVVLSRALGGAVMTAVFTAILLSLVTPTAPQTGAAIHLGSLMDTTSPSSRALVLTAYARLWFSIALAMVVGCILYATVEDRPLHGSAGSDRTAT